MEPFSHRFQATYLSAWVVGAFVLLFVMTSTSAKATPIPRSFYGLNIQPPPKLPSDQWSVSLDRLAETGVGIVRFDTAWESIEPDSPSDGVHRYDWSRLDDLIAELARRDLQGLPILAYSPSWALLDPTPPISKRAPPQPAAYAAFAQALAARYGRGGSFWAANPGIPGQPITQYEVWNEPNADKYFRGADPSTYAALYATARAAIRAVDPTATVMVGGVIASLNGVGWLEALMNALPLHGQEIDAIAWHPYYLAAYEVDESLRALHGALRARGLDPPIDITEVNNVNGSLSASLLSELATSLPVSNCHVTSMFAFTWSSLPPPKQPNPWALTEVDGSLNAVGSAYVSALQSTTTDGASGAFPPYAYCEPPPTVSEQPVHSRCAVVVRWGPTRSAQSNPMPRHRKRLHGRSAKTSRRHSNKHKRRRHAKSPCESYESVKTNQSRQRCRSCRLPSGGQALGSADAIRAR